MFKFFSIILALFVFMACSPTKVMTGAIEKIQFSTSTRGYSQEIEITPDSTFIFVSSWNDESLKKSIRRKTSQVQWKEICEMAEPVLTYKEPTSRTLLNNTDGAASSRMAVLSSHIDVEHYFDNTAPNEEWVPLLKLILNISVDGE